MHRPQQVEKEESRGRMEPRSSRLAAQRLKITTRQRRLKWRDVIGCSVNLCRLMQRLEDLCERNARLWAGSANWRQPAK